MKWKNLFIFKGILKHIMNVTLFHSRFVEDEDICILCLHQTTVQICGNFKSAATCELIWKQVFSAQMTTAPLTV